MMPSRGVSRPHFAKTSLGKGAVMSNDQCSPEISQDSLYAAIENAVFSLPHASELAELEVSEIPSQAVIQSGNVLPFRRSQLNPEEWQKLLDTLAD